MREGDAIAHGTDGAVNADAASLSAPDPQLVCGAGDDLGGSCGGIPQQGETGYQKGVWIPRAENAGNRLISSTWEPCGAGIQQQVQVREPKRVISRCYLGIYSRRFGSTDRWTESVIRLASFWGSLGTGRSRFGDRPRKHSGFLRFGYQRQFTIRSGGPSGCQILCDRANSEKRYGRVRVCSGHLMPAVIGLFHRGAQWPRPPEVHSVQATPRGISHAAANPPRDPAATSAPRVSPIP